MERLFLGVGDLMVRARDCQIVLKIDANSAFWSILLRKNDRPKTVFVKHHRYWRWRYLSFGSKISPACFERILSVILRKLELGEFADNYIDYVFIFSKSYFEHTKPFGVGIKSIVGGGF